jgi:NTP pyrophosphatase (non-canonical NTP hydrolase)
MPDPPDSSPPDSSTPDPSTPDPSTADSSAPDPPASVDPPAPIPASIEEAIARVTRFRQARDWDKFHTPSHLSRSVSVEASELAEEFLWKDSGDIEAHLRSEEGREAVKDEVGDVLIATLLFCERVGIDPLEALGTKLEKTKKKYPVEDD